MAKASKGGTRIAEQRDYERSVGRNARGNKYLADIMKMQDKAERALRLKREKNIIDYKVD
jgi:ribosomal protein S28E/S33